MLFLWNRNQIQRELAKEVSQNRTDSGKEQQVSLLKTLSVNVTRRIGKNLYQEASA